MSRKTVEYTDGEIGEVRVVPDFLPRPEELSGGEETVTVTLALSRRSVEYFQGQARKSRVPYREMIRALIDDYAKRNAP